MTCSEANTDFCFDLFRRLGKDHPDENILLSPLNFTAAVYLLCSSTGNSAAQIERLTCFNEDKKHGSGEYRQYSEEPTCCNASEVSPRTHATHDVSGENLVSPEIPAEINKNAKDEEGKKAQKALHMPLEEEYETKEKPVALLSEGEAKQLNSSWAPVLSSTTSQSKSDDETSNFLPEGEAVNQEQSSPERKAFHSLASMSEDQGGSFANRDYLLYIEKIENIKLSSSYSAERAEESTCSASFPEFECPADHLECEEPKAKLGTFYLVSPLVSEEDNRQSTGDGQRSEVTILQSDTANVLRREDDEVLSPEQYFLEGQVHPNQMNPFPSSERFFQSESVTVSDASSSPVMENSAESTYDSPPQKSGHSVKPMEDKDLKIKEADSSHFTLSPFGMNAGLSCENVVQTLTDTSSQCDSEENIFSDFHSGSKDFLGSKEDETRSQEQSPVDKTSNNQVSLPETQAGLVLNNTSATNLSHSSSVEEISRIMLNNAPMKELKYTVYQVECEESSRGEEATLNLVSLPDAEQQCTSLGQDLQHGLSFDQFAAEMSSDCLPWNKFLSGREQRKARRQSSYPLRQNVFENLNAPSESRIYTRYTQMQIFPLDLEQK